MSFNSTYININRQDSNCGMMIGNFELDFNDGEIGYKTSIDDLVSMPRTRSLLGNIGTRKRDLV
ncbi:MAG: hypothetical protein PUP91_26285 [Rhizonema sp. PD37]|nr:hypothetical protein [Rhizonema sp. PD37]